MPEPLSHDAKVILAAWCDAHGWENVDIPPAVFYGLAAAHRALADAVVPEDPCGNDCCIDQSENIRARILAIATELENHD